jgi:hypothetical protein
MVSDFDHPRAAQADVPLIAQAREALMLKKRFKSLKIHLWVMST